MKQSLMFMVLLGAALTLAASASAGLPKKGGTYVGDIKSSPFAMHVDIKVSPAGTKLLHFTYLCGTGRAPTTVFGVAIDKTGHFKWTKMTGSSVVWKMAGRFVSPATKAFVSLKLDRLRGLEGLDDPDVENLIASLFRLTGPAPAPRRHAGHARWFQRCLGRNGDVPQNFSETRLCKRVSACSPSRGDRT